MDRLLLTLTALLTQLHDQPSAARTAVDPFRGRWVVIFAKADGKLDRRRKGAQVVCEKGRITCQYQSGEVERYTCQRDPVTTPHQIDLEPIPATRGARSIKGIYVVERDHLGVCIDLTGQGRPTEMTAPAGSQRLLLVLEKDLRIIVKQTPKKRKAKKR